MARSIPSVCSGVFVYTRSSSVGESRSPRARRAPLALAALLWLVASVTHAAPVAYGVASGNAAIRVLVGASEIGSTATSLVGGSVTIDAVAQSLDALNIVLGPNVPLALTSPYGGYDDITIETVSLTDAVGYTSSLLSSVGSTFQVLAGPLDVAGSWAATDSTATNPPQSGVPIGFEIPSLLSIVNGSVTMNGVTLALLDGTPFGESEPLQIVADIQIAFVPEPSAALLLGLSLAALSAGTRHRRH